MANNITADPNCISLWRFESGAMLTDAMGNNTLTHSNPSYPPLEDTSVYHEGDCSAQYTYIDEEPYEIDDSNLSADFPLKNGGGKTTFSWVAWVNINAIGSDPRCIGKMDAVAVDTAVFISVATETWGFDASGNETDSGIGIAWDTWQHIAVTYDGATGQLTIRVYDEATASVDSYQTTLTGGDVVAVGTKPWTIGDPDWYLAMNIDEVAVFDDVLTPAEIDEIRAETFGGGGGGEEQTTGDGGGISTLFLGCPF